MLISCKNILSQNTTFAVMLFRSDTNISPRTSSFAVTLFWRRKCDWHSCFIVGGIYNAILMYIMYKIRKHHEKKIVDILILSLCFTDLIFSFAAQLLLINHILSSIENISLLQLLNASNALKL